MAATYVSMDRLDLQERIRIELRSTTYSAIKNVVLRAHLYVWYGPVEDVRMCWRTWQEPFEVVRTRLPTWHGPVEVVRTCLRMW